MMSETLPPRRSAGAAPPRPPGSVRRTSSIDVAWPQGRGERARMYGRARDVVTPRAGGAPIVCAEDSFEAVLRFDRTIEAITAHPPRPALQKLVGERGGGKLRQAIAAALPEEARAGSPLHLILDDIAGVSLVSNWAWSQWDPDWLGGLRDAQRNPELAKAFGERVNICIGLAEGSSAFQEGVDRSGTPTPDLRNPEDPEGWHAWPEMGEGISMRRARRVDLTEDDVLRIEAAFQDSATTPAGGRAVVHEYTLSLTADPATLEVLAIEARPRVLPYRECPGAAANVTRLLGARLPELRERVLAELRKTAGCTHLNDALRALADAPALVALLPQAV
jgi:hypothetical protein